MHISKSELNQPKHSTYSFKHLRSDLYKPSLIGCNSNLLRASHLLHLDNIRSSFSLQCEINSVSLLRIFMPLFAVPFIFEDLGYQILRFLFLRKNLLIEATSAAKTSKLSPVDWQHKISHRLAARLTWLNESSLVLPKTGLSLVYRCVMKVLLPQCGTVSDLGKCMSIFPGSHTKHWTN